MQTTKKKTVFILCSIAILIVGCGPATGDAAGSSQLVDALFEAYTKGVQPGAAVMVIHDGEIVHLAGYGYANLEERTPIDADSAFRLASVSKQFTAMAVMLLAEDGKLAYDDPISRYLPALAPYEGVTIRHLLTEMVTSSTITTRSTASLDPAACTRLLMISSGGTAHSTERRSSAAVRSMKPIHRRF